MCTFLYYLKVYFTYQVKYSIHTMSFLLQCFLVLQQEKVHTVIWMQKSSMAESPRERNRGYSLMPHSLRNVPLPSVRLSCKTYCKSLSLAGDTKTRSKTNDSTVILKIFQRAIGTWTLIESGFLTFICTWLQHWGKYMKPNLKAVACIVLLLGIFITLI